MTVLFPPDESCYASSVEKIPRNMMILDLPTIPGKFFCESKDYLARKAKPVDSFRHELGNFFDVNIEFVGRTLGD